MKPPNSVKISRNKIGYEVIYTIPDNIKKVVITGDNVYHFTHKPKIKNAVWMEQEVRIKIRAWHKGFELDFIEELTPSFCLLSIDNDTLYIEHTDPWIKLLKVYDVSIYLKMNINDKDVENTTKRSDRYTWKLQ